MKSEKKVILIVDQSLLVLERMIPMLEELANVEYVVHAGNYKDAMDLLGGMRPDVILMDIDLPDRSGMDLMQAIKAKYENITVFITSNFVTDQHRDLFKRLGAHGYFDKSVDYEQITETVACQPC
jgi:DNA-binding NarL/FixJ family response regulator